MTCINCISDAASTMYHEIFVYAETIGLLLDCYWIVIGLLLDCYWIIIGYGICCNFIVYFNFTEFIWISLKRPICNVYFRHRCLIYQWQCFVCPKRVYDFVYFI